MNEIEKKLVAIHKKYGKEYVSFEITFLSDGSRTWNVYTPVIGHNNFKVRAEFVAFLDLLFSKTPTEYKKFTLEKLAKRQVALKEELNYIADKINEHRGGEG